MISLLFLINDNIYQSKLFESYFQNCNVHIHPKLTPAPHLKKYVIKEIVKTEWSKYSIVQATINLLKKAYSNIDNEWFILLSYDSAPNYNYTELKGFLDTQTKSIFSLNTIIKKPPIPYYKTSQWWALKRGDVQTILNNYKEFNDLNQHFKSLKGSAVDEIYFLSLLKYYDSQYQYSNFKWMYDKWNKGTIQKHPMFINRLLKTDWVNIKIQNSFFTRKILNVPFERKPIEPKPTLLFIYIGTESTQNYTNIIENNRYDIILIISIPIDLIDPLIVKRSIQIINIIYSFYWNTVASIITDPFFPLDEWEKIGFTGETFDVEGIERYSLEKEWENPIKNDIPMIPMIPMLDEKGGKSYWIMPKKGNNISIVSSLKLSPFGKIAFLFLTRKNVNFPEIWKSYFKGNEDKINLYIHPKEPEGVKWLSDSIIQNRVHTEWGFIVEAYFNLLREAMKNPENTKFIVISESCLPLKTFDEFYQRVIIKDDIRTSYIKFLKVSNYDWKERIQTQPHYKKMGNFIKHYARFCLSRYHVEKLFYMSSPTDLVFFSKMHVGDEFFLSLLKPVSGKDYIKDFEITYDNWEMVQKQKNEINEEIKKLYELMESNLDVKDANTDENISIMNCIKDIKKMRDTLGANPYSYKTVDNNIIKTAIKKESFFWRKFPTDSNIENYYSLMKGIPLLLNSSTRSSKKSGTKSSKKSSKTNSNKTKRISL
jgi:hypothetical protein